MTLPPGTPSTLQVTAVFTALVTTAPPKPCGLNTVTLAVAGLIADIVTVCGVTVTGAMAVSPAPLVTVRV